MLNDATLKNFEDRFQLVQSKDTVQSAHCALAKWTIYLIVDLFMIFQIHLIELKSRSGDFGKYNPGIFEIYHVKQNHDFKDFFGFWFLTNVFPINPG